MNFNTVHIHVTYIFVHCISVSMLARQSNVIYENNVAFQEFDRRETMLTKRTYHSPNSMLLAWDAAFPSFADSWERTCEGAPHAQWNRTPVVTTSRGGLYPPLSGRIAEHNTLPRSIRTKKKTAPCVFMQSTDFSGLFQEQNQRMKTNNRNVNMDVRE